MAKDIKISIRNLYKIFGPTPDVALEYVRKGMGKAELLEQQKHVLGLRDINVDMHDGEITVIMGLSGSGKSTLIRHLNRLIDPTAGEIRVDGEDVMSYSEEQLRRLRRERMSMVFQKFALLPHKTVLENAGMAKDIRGYTTSDFEADARKWLARVGLEGNEHQYPHQLSGGMQQRVGLARALCSNPDILLMDEAFSALDPLIRRQMQDELMAIQDKVHKTILFITHDLNEALRMGSRICILRDGLVIQIGTPEEILTEPADGYVAEFVQDVDQGRVIDVGKVMHDAVILDSTSTLTQCIDALGDRRGGFVVDADNRPTAMLSLTDAATALAHGTTDLGSVLRSDFDTTTPGARFNENYAAAGRGQPIAVVDESGRLIGELEPREIMEEMGRVEQLVDGFEREVFL